MNKYLYVITAFILSLFITTSSFSGHHEKAVGYFGWFGVGKTYTLGNSSFTYKELHIISSSFSTSASLAAVKFDNLPTTQAQARILGSGSLWVSGSGTGAGAQSKHLMVFTG